MAQIQDQILLFVHGITWQKIGRQEMVHYVVFFFFMAVIQKVSHK